MAAQYMFYGTERMRSHYYMYRLCLFLSSKKKELKITSDGNCS